MRRRRDLTVWPAVADLMTVLAVLGLFSALALIPTGHEERENLEERLRELERENDHLEQKNAELLRETEQLSAELADLRAEHEALREQCRQQQEECEAKIVRNERMFQAIERVQEIVDELSADQALEFGDDQTLEFGDDLVDYDLNSTHPIFRPAGKERLRRFCELLDAKLTAGSTKELNLRELFVIEVQGHTDSTSCPGDPHCNWWVSASRAAHFMALMHDKSLCPQGSGWRLQASGFADTQPATGSGGLATRRIEVRIIPEYEKIISGNPHGP